MALFGILPSQEEATMHSRAACDADGTAGRRDWCGIACSFQPSVSHDSTKTGSVFTAALVKAETYLPLQQVDTHNTTQNDISAPSRRIGLG